MWSANESRQVAPDRRAGYPHPDPEQVARQRDVQMHYRDGAMASAHKVGYTAELTVTVTLTITVTITVTRIRTMTRALIQSRSRILTSPGELRR